MRGMRKGKDKDNNDYRNHFGGGGDKNALPSALWNR